MSEHKAQTIEAKHIFIDIVEYTHERCVEAQSDLIEILNKIVKESVKELGIDDSLDIIYSSTGDGMCITLKNIFNPYDIHMQIALLILEKKAEHNKKETRKMRTFDLRIGINENTDNLIIDINGEDGVSGSGINDAARLEGLCDNNQILVGKSVHNKLEQREMYIDSFIERKTTVKHGKPLEAYQYIDKTKGYLNNDIPKQFIVLEIKQEKIVISELQAFYMISCIKHEDFSKKFVSDYFNIYILPVLHWHLANDELSKFKNKEGRNEPIIRIEKDIELYYTELRESSYWVLTDFASTIEKHELRNISNYFIDNCFYINKKGKEALINSYPDLCKEYDINI